MNIQGELNMNEKQASSHIMLVDGMALLFRAFYATAITGQFQINSKGIPTNAVSGFLKHMLTAVSSFNPSHLAVCWDMGSKTFRSELYTDYKGNRGEAPIELIPQFDLVKEVVASFDIPNIGLVGYEADDCIGTVAKALKDDMKVSILTGDQDILQLLEENISVILLKKGFGNYHVHTPDSFYEEKGITPRQMIDLKGLMGDPSDNYPGVKGIGEKTALKLLQQFESIDGILQNLNDLSKSHRTKIEQGIEMLHLSRTLAEIKCDVPVSCSITDSELRYDRSKVINMLDEIELKGIHRYLAEEKEYA
jgi:5'-3' exonuclease